MGTATITDSSTGAFSYATTSTVSGNDSLTYKVNDGYVESAVHDFRSIKNRSAIQVSVAPDNTGQTIASTAGVRRRLERGQRPSGRICTGQGVVVAVVDDGLEILHEDPQLMLSLVDLTTLRRRRDPTEIDSDGGHGTSIAGIIAQKVGMTLVCAVLRPMHRWGFNFLQSSSDANLANSLGGASYSSDVDIFNLSFGRSGVWARTFEVDSNSMQATYQGPAHYVRAKVQWL